MCLSECVCRCVRVNRSLVSMSVCVKNYTHHLLCSYIDVCLMECNDIIVKLSLKSCIYSLYINALNVRPEITV